MRILGIHTKFFQFESKEKATQGAESIPREGHKIKIEKECIVIFISVEKGDSNSPSSVASQLSADTIKRAKQLNAQTVVLYPYVHLTDDPATPRIALKVLDEIESRLRDSLEVIHAPFGWYKAFEISCLGHPLSEWSGRYHPEGKVEIKLEKGPQRKPSEFTRFVIADMDGNTFEVTPDNFSKCPVFSDPDSSHTLLKQFVTNELEKGPITSTPPKHIPYMLRHELLDYCDASEKGHYKWYTKGLFMQKLILDYAAEIAHDWGAFEIKNPIIIRGDHNVVGELMGEFHERDYQVDGGRGICYLRYASDPLAFPFMQNVRFSYKQSPLKIYEETACFRNEQEGEISGLKRVRGFIMTDMHAACANIDEARREFEILCSRFSDIMNNIIAKGRWVLGWEGTIDFFEENKEWLVSIGKRVNVPAFFKLMPQMSHYYAMKNEYQFITEDKTNIQISTVQWDVKDGKRFDIGYIDEKGIKHPCPVIIHASSFGSIERSLCAILENIAIDEAAGIHPMFPLWLSPTQVRIITVSSEYLPFAEILCERISKHKIRVDIDDHDLSVAKKIRNAEKEWVPYILVMGEREKNSEMINVRIRENGIQKEMSVDGLVELIHTKTKGMPFRPLPLPILVSKRPIFYG